MTWWIAVFFSTMGIWNSPHVSTGGNMNMDQAIMALNEDHNAFAILASTHLASAYIDAITTNEGTVSNNRCFKATEQTVIFFIGNKPPLIASKFLAPLQWMVLSKTMDDKSSTMAAPSITQEHFFVNTDSIALVNFASARAKYLNISYRIYRGQEYMPKEVYDFAFIAK